VPKKWKRNWSSLEHDMMIWEEEGGIQRIIRRKRNMRAEYFSEETLDWTRIENCEGKLAIGHFNAHSKCNSKSTSWSRGDYWRFTNGSRGDDRGFIYWSLGKVWGFTNKSRNNDRIYTYRSRDFLRRFAKFKLCPTNCIIPRCKVISQRLIASGGNHKTFPKVDQLILMRKNIFKSLFKRKCF